MNTLLYSLIMVMYSAMTKMVFDIFSKSIRYMGAERLNELPEILKNSTSKFSFKRKTQKINAKLYVNLNYFEPGNFDIEE